MSIYCKQWYNKTTAHYEIVYLLSASLAEDALRSSHQQIPPPRNPNPHPSMNEVQLSLFDYFFGDYVYYPADAPAK